MSSSPPFSGSGPLPPVSRPVVNDRAGYLRALCRTVPWPVVESVLASQTELALTQRCDGTLLNADLVGFTSLCEEAAAGGQHLLEGLTTSLNKLFSRLLEEALFPYGGIVMQFGGDSVTAIFRGDDHSFRAAAAALQAQQIMQDDDFGLGSVGGRRILLRVGLASGEITMPVVGDVVRRTLVCAGVAAHRAVTHEHRATPGTVLADVHILERLRDRARIGEISGDAGVILGLNEWPKKQSPPHLPPDFADNVEAKIALLEPFVPAPLAARLRTTPDGWRIDGELRKVVILFADIIGVDHEVSAEVQLNLSRSALRSYRKFGGTVAKVNLASSGQRVMVLFGLHMPSGHDAERAVLAALEATARVRGFLSAIGSPLQIRTGIHSGQVYFGAFGSDLRHDVTVVGDAVNTAARIAEAAGSFDVLVTEETMQSIAEDFVTSARPPIRVRGKQETLAVRAVHSTSDGSARYMQTRKKQRILSGREPEMAKLRALAEKASSGAGVLTGIAGDRGDGTSALLSLLVDEWINRGGLGMLGKCRYATKAVPLAPIVAMFAAFLGITSSATDDERYERIRSGLEPYHLTNHAPELMALLQPVRRPDGAHEAIVDLADIDARE
ncbi:MAG: adenylate/guanylate cyclase domain-containing protein, partial [Polyangiaceae bacterium]